MSEMNRIYLGCVLLLAMTACQDVSMESDRSTASAPELQQEVSGIHGLQPPQPLPLLITTNKLPPGRVGASYLAKLTAIGGNKPLSWRLVSGPLPGGLTLAVDGTLSGTPTTEGTTVLIVEVTDGVQRVRKPLGLVVYMDLVLTTEALPGAFEGITWLSAPGVPVRLSARGGQPPLTFSASPLPAGLTLDAASGSFSGAPAQGSAGHSMVTVRVSDAAGDSVERVLPLETRIPRPIAGGGAASLPPRGSPLTDTLTVFTVDSAGRALQGVGVRVRRNGQEYDPPRQALSDATGKVVFTGLGLDGDSDTVDITANGRHLQNMTMARVNAALVTLSLGAWPLPMPRTDFVSATDPDSGRILVTGGYNALGTWGCIDNVVELGDATTNTWHEPVLHGMPATMPARVYGAGAFASGTLVVFGGLTCLDSTYPAETWEYDSDARVWTRWDVAGPESRNAAAMAADGTGQHVVLFGGYSTSAWMTLDDTWVYTPATHAWTQRFPVGPIPTSRFDAATAFDPVHGEMVVCGGTHAFLGDLSDCNAYSSANNTWRPLPSMPSIREDFGLAFHPATGELYAFGGKVAGLDRNDLLVLRDGAWLTRVPDGAPGAPPKLHGHALVADARSGQLLVVGGARQADGRISGDVWSFAPSTGQWTWRNAPPPSRPSVRLSGLLSGGPSGTRIQATVQVSGDGGYLGQRTVTLVGGTGRYELPNVPLDERLSITAYVVDRSVTPAVLWSHADLGVVGPFTADTSLDIAFPPGPLPLRTTTATLALNESWLSTAYLSGSAYRQRPGFFSETNGVVQADLAGRSLRFDTIPLQPGTEQWFTAILTGQTPTTCVSAWVYWEGTPSQPLAVPSPSTNLTPGVAECIVGPELPTVAQESWSLTPPEGTKLLQVGIGAALAPDDWLYMAPVGEQPVAFQLPEPSTLAPSRPRPPGQHVSWYVDTGLFTTSAFDYDDFSLAFMQPDAWVRAEPYVYVRAKE
jgi:hypothetical protein